MRLNSSFLLLSRCLFNSKNKPVCQEHPENLNVHLLLIIRLIFNSTKITFFNIVWDTELLKQSFVSPPPIARVAQGAGLDTVFTVDAFMKSFEKAVKRA